MFIQRNSNYVDLESIFGVFQPSWSISVIGINWYAYLIYIGREDCWLSTYGFLSFM